MKQLVGALLAAVALAGCQSQDDRIAFDGKYFRAKARKVDGNFEQFAVRVKPVSASLQGAREAGRFEATTYCVNNFGTSEIEWIAGPDAPQAGLVIEGDTLILQGVCPNR